MNAGIELDALIDAAVMGRVWDAQRCRICGWPLGEHCTAEYCSQRPAPVHRADEHMRYSEDIAAAWRVVCAMHAQLDPAAQGVHQLLTLMCVGHYQDCWAASFDFELTDDWYEADRIGEYPFAARAETAPLAICLAALRAVGVEV